MTSASRACLFVALLTAAACGDPIAEARPEIVFGLGAPMRCLDGAGCPSECACDGDVGFGTCQRTDGGGVCAHGEVGLGGDSPDFSALSGSWTEGWTCLDLLGGGSLSGVQTEVVQDVGLIMADRIAEQAPMEGVLVGPDFVWTRETDTYRETGVFTFTSADRFTSSTVWEDINGFSGGACVGEGVRASDPEANGQQP